MGKKTISGEVLRFYNPLRNPSNILLQKLLHLLQQF